MGRALGLPVVHLDVLHWRPGWVEPPRDVWRGIVARAVEREEWIIDGNFSGTLDLRLTACDTVVFLDLPRTLCVWRVLKRLMTYRGDGGPRPDMAEGCGEKFDPKFLKWVWDYPRRTRPKVLERIARHAAGKRVFRLRTQAEVERFLSGLGREASAGRAAAAASSDV